MCVGCRLNHCKCSHSMHCKQVLLLYSVWTDEASCTIMNSTIVWDMNCSYSCGAECWKSSRYPCLQVYVSLNSSGKVIRLLHNEETQDSNPEVLPALSPSNCCLSFCWKIHICFCVFILVS